MASESNYTVQQVLQQLPTDHFDNCGDKDKETQLQEEEFIPTCNTRIERSTVIQTAVKMSKTELLLLQLFILEVIILSSPNTVGQLTARKKTEEKHNWC